MVRAHDTLGEDEVDQEQQQDTGLGKDTGGDGHLDVVRHGSPADAEAQRHDTGHAEAENDDREDELMISPTVHLKNEHVRGGSDEVDEEHHGADRDVQGDRGTAAQLGRLGRVGGPWRSMLSKGMLAMRLVSYH